MARVFLLMVTERARFGVAFGVADVLLEKKNAGTRRRRLRRLRRAS